jgi:soluble P-type ATPase
MIEVTVPDWGTLRAEYLVLDYNGTLAVDGILLPGVKEALTALAENLHIHVLTADTFGKARAALEGVPCDLTILPADDQAGGKQRFVQDLGVAATVAVGNGRNDRMMLEASALGIAVVQHEGAAGVTLASADIVCPNIVSALELLSNRLRLIATLRS